MEIIPKNTKGLYLFEGVNETLVPEEIAMQIRSFMDAENLYLSACREIVTKLENLNSEFKYTQERNPIHNISSRVKSPVSIMQKLQQRGHELSVESAKKHLTDIAGVRVICSYIKDIYLIGDLLASQDDVQLVRKSDYIKNPKPNGYRSLHLIVTIPVFQSSKTELVNVEIQIRTIAMDFWASLEHELAYKLEEVQKQAIYSELKVCASQISDIDQRMQKLHNNISLLKKNKVEE